MDTVDGGSGYAAVIEGGPFVLTASSPAAATLRAVFEYVRLGTVSITEVLLTIKRRNRRSVPLEDLTHDAFRPGSVPAGCAPEVLADE